MTDRLQHTLARWARLGAGFDVDPSSQTPDLERLLLDTARDTATMSRLFIMAATWLHTYGDLIARHRLRRLIHAELEAEHRAVLGLLLARADQGVHPARFATITRDLPAADPPRPLFTVEQSPASLAMRAERNASPLSRDWGLWSAPIELKPDALRPVRWLFEHNPSLAARADFRGDLRSSILASLRHDVTEEAGELGLARACGGSRSQVRRALHNLELSGRVKRIAHRPPRPTTIRLADTSATLPPSF